VRSASKAKVGFPDLSTFKTVADLAEWYYLTPLADTGRTPQQLEAAGADDSFAWRGGPQHRHQRWAEYQQLLRAIEAECDILTSKQRSTSNNPHRIVRVEPVIGGQQLDVQRSELGLTVCEYREYINKKGKGYNKGLENAHKLTATAAAMEAPAMMESGAEALAGAQ
jgi:hypothetical protein